MPPAAIASSVGVDHASQRLGRRRRGRGARSRSSRSSALGELGRAAEAAVDSGRSSPSSVCDRRASRSDARARRPPARRRRRRGATASVSSSALLVEIVAAVAARPSATASRARRRTPACPWRASGGKYVPPKKGRPSGVRNTVMRPAAAARHGLHRLHVDRVDVGPLLAVDLDADELLVQQPAIVGVLEDSWAMTWHQWHEE